MYPVSATYKDAIIATPRRSRITGTITLVDNSTITITEADIAGNTLRITEMCSAGENIEVGNVMAADLAVGLMIPIVNPYSLQGARVALNFEIVTGQIGGVDTWEAVPLGYFYVDSIAREATSVNITAVDGMILLDVPLGSTATAGTPPQLIAAACNTAGLVLATQDFTGYANAALPISVPADSEIVTCRDLIMWALQLMAASARMDRTGQLEVFTLHGDPQKTIGKAERYPNTRVSDTEVEITQVTMVIDGTTYSQGTDGMTLTLDENPLLQGMEAADINAALAAILADISLAVYQPYSISIVGDPAVQAGDWITLQDTNALSGDFSSLVTHSTWAYRGHHNIKGTGKDARLPARYSQQAKAISSIKTLAKAAQLLATANSQSTQLITDAIGGNVLIRQAAGETNEILIMDSPDPDAAVKIWRWNMGGFGYSDNCTGADNPARVYEVAITMDGAINANFIKTGTLSAGIIFAGELTGASGTFMQLTAGVAGKRRLHMGEEGGDPFIRIYNDDDDIVLELDRFGITFENGSKIQPITVGSLTGIGFFAR